MSPREIKRKRIGDILIEAGQINEEDLQHALEKQGQSGKKIGEILIDLEYVTAEEIIQFLALQFRIPFIKIENYEISSDMVNLIPKSLALKYVCIPLDKMGDAISFVVSDPTNLYDLKQQESFLNCTMNFFLTTPQSLEEAIKKYYGV